ncbi:hypothetical protein RRG08_047437 [Elysia crispata]|uniref:Uncharacterized protein n=1 Tax=Elysia crispata TaxID=231223 RepID=A0AAE1D4N3_9GAST|nr:hypothetical protein RRG08_047437 [Elysia crispata]
MSHPQPGDTKITSDRTRSSILQVKASYGPSLLRAHSCCLVPTRRGRIQGHWARDIREDNPWRLLPST